MQIRYRKGFIYSPYNSPYIHIQWQFVISWPGSSSVSLDKKKKYSPLTVLVDANRLTVIWEAGTQQHTEAQKGKLSLALSFWRDSSERDTLTYTLELGREEPIATWIQASLSIGVFAFAPCCRLQAKKVQSSPWRNKKGTCLSASVTTCKLNAKVCAGELCSPRSSLIVCPFVKGSA